MKSVIYNIERFSIHDGPGIRTTVFFKGCNLRCFWCHSPESQAPDPELQVFDEKCVHCGRCVKVCPNEAHIIADSNQLFLRERCDACGKCSESCPNGALILCGKEMTTDELFREILRDKDFYDSSGGGVTLSGGEPLLQIESAVQLLKKSKAVNIHTAIETAGNVGWGDFERILKHTDLVIFDLKAVDSLLHRDSTGFSNDLILDNLAKLMNSTVNLIIRIPVIPGVNDTISRMKKSAELLNKAQNIQYVELLKFNKLGRGKYDSLNRAYLAKELKEVKTEQLKQLASVFEYTGLKVKQPISGGV